MELKEEWKPVVGYEGYYEVSNKCRVRSIERTATNKYRNGQKRVHGVLRRTEVNHFGREQVVLSKDGKTKKYFVYRLMAAAFIPNPNNYPEINHKDENPMNNTLENLEWCEHLYNCNYGTRNKRISKYVRKQTIIVDGKGKEYIFTSRHDAAVFLNVVDSAISDAIRYKRIVNKKYIIKE
jgi:hypothetical protein